MTSSASWASRNSSTCGITSKNGRPYANSVTLTIQGQWAAVNSRDLRDSRVPPKWASPQHDLLTLLWWRERGFWQLHQLPGQTGFPVPCLQISWQRWPWTNPGEHSGVAAADHVFLNGSPRPAPSSPHVGVTLDSSISPRDDTVCSHIFMGPADPQALLFSQSLASSLSINTRAQHGSACPARFTPPLHAHLTSTP